MKKEPWFRRNIKNILHLTGIVWVASTWVFITSYAKNSTTATLGLYGIVLVLCTPILSFFIKYPKIRREVLRLEESYMELLFPSYLVMSSFLLMLTPNLIVSFKSALNVPSEGLVFGILFGVLFTILTFLGKLRSVVYSNIPKSAFKSPSDKLIDKDTSIIFYFATTYLFALFLSNMLFFAISVVPLIHWIFI